MRDKISEVLSTAKCGMHKSIKLNYFEHINILQSCNQPGIDNKCNNFISEMVSCLEIKIQGIFLQKTSEVRKAYTVKCPKKNVM